VGGCGGGLGGKKVIGGGKGGGEEGGEEGRWGLGGVWWRGERGACAGAKGGMEGG